MKRVWIVESGDYSDYGVEAIFETEEQAREFSSHLPESSFREWVLNTWTERQSRFEFVFDMAGHITSERETAYVNEPTEEADQIGLSRHEQHCLRITVDRGPRDRAVKIASERYVRVRSVLDEADARVSRSGLFKGRHEGGCYWVLTTMVANVLAGIEQLPDKPTEQQSGFDRALLQVFGK